MWIFIGWVASPRDDDGDDDDNDDDNFFVCSKTGVVCVFVHLNLFSVLNICFSFHTRKMRRRESREQKKWEFCFVGLLCRFFPQRKVWELKAFLSALPPLQGW